MEKKKRSQLENKRKVYFSLGLFIVSTGVLCAFTYKVPINLEKIDRVTNQETDIPFMLVEKEVEKEKPDLPKVVKLPNSKPSTPIFNPDLLIKIKPIGNKRTTSKSTISTLKNNSFSFNPDPGKAPKLTEVVKYPDRDPVFSGNWRKYLENNIVYPDISIKSGESGEVYVRFVVERDGSLSNIEVMNKEQIGVALQKEALRVVKNSPNWKPGINNGEKVRTNMVVKINFILGG